MTKSLFEFFEKNDNAEDEGLLRLINKGLEVNSDRQQTFWDDFLNVMTADPEKTSELLEISREVISKWRPKIKKMVEKVKEKNKNYKKKNKMLDTGV